MIAGNHDCWGGDVLRDDAGVDYQFGPWTGDGGRLARRASSMATGCARTRTDAIARCGTCCGIALAIRAFRWLHPDLATPLATHSSDASRTYGARDGGRGLRAGGASDAAAERPDVDLIVYGHSHVADARSRSPSGRGVRQRRLVAGRADVPAHHAVTRRAAPVGGLSRECGSRRPRSSRRESAVRAVGTAADRRRR